MGRQTEGMVEKVDVGGEGRRGSRGWRKGKGRFFFPESI